MNASLAPQTGPVRLPAVAGSFYPGDAPALSSAVRKYLAEADRKIAKAADRVPKAIIAPHAGYVYSGLTAAAAYRALAPARGIIKRVVMMGPCHRVAVRGLALPSSSAFRTPLGDVPVDHDAVAAIRDLPGVGTMWARAGGVTAHPDNAYRLLKEDEQLVLVFPEGTKGTGKLSRDRYRLARFGRGGFVEIAMRAGVPIQAAPLALAPAPLQSDCICALQRGSFE